LVSLSL